MTRSSGAILTDRAVVAVSGPEAGAFLQGIVTVDMEDVDAGRARHGALLTPQGKILFEFMVAPGEEDYRLDVRAELAAEFIKRLMFYRLRAKAEIAQRDDLAVAALWGEDASPSSLPGAFADPRLPALGYRAILPADDAARTLESAGARVADAAAYRAWRIALGVPELGEDYETGELFPHEADHDQLAGVDFDKGCFVGQEVVSRMQHRGTARKRFVPVSVTGDPPPRDSDITAEGRRLGNMASSADGRGLALIRLDRLGEAMANGQAIEAAGARLVPERPDWARFDWPGAAS